MAVIDYLMLGLAFILLLMSTIFAFVASSGLPRISGYSSDTKLKSAQSLLIGSGVLSLMALLTVIGMFLLILLKKLSKFIAIIMTMVVLLFSFISGILASVAATNIRGSTSYPTDVGSTYTLAVVTAIFNTGLVVMLSAIYLVILFFRKSEPMGISIKSKQAQNAGSQAAATAAVLATTAQQSPQQAKAASTTASNAAIRIVQDYEKAGYTPAQLQAITQAVVPIVAQSAVSGVPTDQIVKLAATQIPQALNPPPYTVAGPALTPENFPVRPPTPGIISPEQGGSQPFRPPTPGIISPEQGGSQPFRPPTPGIISPEQGGSQPFRPPTPGLIAPEQGVSQPFRPPTPGLIAPEQGGSQPFRPPTPGIISPEQSVPQPFRPPTPGLIAPEQGVYESFISPEQIGQGVPQQFI